jgi:cysteine synthase B
VVDFSASVDRRQRVVELVGNTPLLQLSRIDPTLPPGVHLFAKAEWYNPGGSVKDRPVLSMLRDAEQRGVLRPGMRVADATSGNTGIAYATLGAALGYPITIAMPGNASLERKRILTGLGAELLLTDPVEGIDGAIQAIRDLLVRNPDAYFYPDQFNNPANPLAHYTTTGPEIWQQTGGAITHFVTALGTSGTFMGTGRFLREQRSNIQLLAVQPDGPLHALEGVKHMASTIFVPGIYSPQQADGIIEVSSELALKTMRQLAAREGLLVGVSAGANVAAALQVARQLEQGMVVTILCDSGSRYLSESFWDG